MSLSDFAEFMWKWVMDGVKGALCWLLTTVADMVIAAVNVALDILPPELVTWIDFPTLILWLGWLDTWLPMTEGLAMFIVYLEFLVTFTAVRFIVKLIPTIG